MYDNMVIISFAWYRSSKAISTRVISTVRAQMFNINGNAVANAVDCQTQSFSAGCYGPCDTARVVSYCSMDAIHCAACYCSDRTVVWPALFRSLAYSPAVLFIIWLLFFRCMTGW